MLKQFDWIAKPEINETAIFWNKYYFEKIKEDCIRVYSSHVSLIKLKPKFSNKFQIIIANVHLTFPGTQEEITTGKSPRIMQMEYVCQYVEKNYKTNSLLYDEIVYIMGDCNDHFHTINVALKYGYHHCFFDCHYQVSPITFPTSASHVVLDGPDPQSAVTYDWIMCNNFDFENKKKKNFYKNNLINVNGVTCSVLNYNYHGVFPSDHYPIQAIYQIQTK